MPVLASLHNGLKSVKWNKPCPLEVSFGHVVEHKNRNQMRAPIPKQGKVINYPSEGTLTNWTWEGKLSALTNGVRRIGGLSGSQSLPSASPKLQLSVLWLHAVYTEFIPYSSRSKEGGSGKLGNWYQCFHPSTRLHSGQSLWVGALALNLSIWLMSMTHVEVIIYHGRHTSFHKFSWNTP